MSFSCLGVDNLSHKVDICLLVTIGKFLWLGIIEFLSHSILWWLWTNYLSIVRVHLLLAILVLRINCRIPIVALVVISEQLLVFGTLNRLLFVIILGQFGRLLEDSFTNKLRYQFWNLIILIFNMVTISYLMFIILCEWVGEGVMKHVRVVSSFHGQVGLHVTISWLEKLIILL